MTVHNALLGFSLLLALLVTFGVEAKINLFALAFACFIASLLV